MDTLSALPLFLGRCNRRETPTFVSREFTLLHSWLDAHSADSKTKHKNITKAARLAQAGYCDIQINTKGRFKTNIQKEINKEVS